MKRLLTEYTILNGHSHRYPVSGAGAGRFGGRFNRIGVNALYLSLELETALAEYRQLDALMPPALMVSYRVKVDLVVDFRSGYTSAWNPLWQEFHCDWRRMVYHEKIEPPSWVIGDQVIATGAKGILFPSVLGRGTNLVLYTDRLDGADAVEAYDPKSALPQNQDSWK